MSRVRHRFRREISNITGAFGWLPALLKPAQAGYRPQMICPLCGLAERAGVKTPITWHVFRHTFSTLLVQTGSDVKTTQSLMRHANPSITFGIYTHSVDKLKRGAQNKVVATIGWPIRALTERVQ